MIQKLQIDVPITNLMRLNDDEGNEGSNQLSKYFLFSNKVENKSTFISLIKLESEEEASIVHIFDLKNINIIHINTHLSEVYVIDD